MSRIILAFVIVLISVSFAFAANAATPLGTRTVKNSAGDVILSLDPAGRPISPSPRVDRVARPSNGRMPLDDVGTTGSCEPGTRDGLIFRESRARGGVVDACGQVHGDGAQQVTPGVEDAGPSAVATNATIDSMTTGWTHYGYGPSIYLDLFGPAETYFLSDGTSWTSGAGSFRLGSVRLDHVEVAGNIVRYYFLPPADGVLYQQTDFNSGYHSAQGRIGTTQPLMLEAEIGSRTAVMRGRGTLVSNDPTYYESFNYYSAATGTELPWSSVYTLSSGSWTPDVFDRPMNYDFSGRVSFVRRVQPRALVDLTISGPVDVSELATFQYRAMARYDDGTVSDATANATWSVDPASLAGIVAGQLATHAIHAPQANLTLHASFTEGGGAQVADLSVLCHAAPAPTPATSWPMYQADSRHTGYVALSQRANQFATRWSRQVGAGYALNPVSAADGRVFCSLVTYFNSGATFFGLDAATGGTLWSQDFGDIFSINPPSYAAGHVYLQTCSNYLNTWFYSFDAATGGFDYRVPFGAQWERYFAPTIFDGNVYVDGGSYGGMYAFEGTSGSQLWYEALPQYDEWTPAVDDEFAYAYVGEYAPGLYVVHRTTGALAYMVPDLDFEWDGWSMNVAPVLGRHADVIAVHDGRLINFDTASHAIRWQLARAFTGQPSVAHDAIFAIDAGTLVVLDEVTHARLWSWLPPSGSLVGSMVVTDTHVFASTDNAVYAIDLATHQSVWSRSGGGKLAFANETLYIAGTNGVLTAIAAPRLLQAHAGPDTSVACAGTSGTPVRLDGRGSQAPGAAFLWSAPGISFDDPTSPTPTGRFPGGRTPVALAVSLGGETARDTVAVTVDDREAPRMSVVVGPVLWPPDHKFVPVHVDVTLEDGCDPSPSFTLTSIACLPEGGGSISTNVAGADLGTPDQDFMLMAEKPQGGVDRRYVVTYTAADHAGNTTTATTTIRVPHDMSGTAAAGGSGMAGETAIPLVTQLGFARPNPARGVVSLTVDLASERPAHIEVYDLRGARVRTLMQGVQPAGRYVLTWDGKDGAGHPAAKGIYIVRMESADYVATRKVLMTR